MIRSFKKPSGQALALNPYIVENPAGVQFQFVVHFQFVILCAEEKECNCLRGQVNGHKAILYFTLSTTYPGIFPR